MEIKVVVQPNPRNPDKDELFVVMDGARIKVGNVRRGYSQAIDVKDALSSGYCWEWISGWLNQEYMSSSPVRSPSVAGEDCWWSGLASDICQHCIPEGGSNV